MSEHRKTSANEIYFLTISVIDWINLFDREIYKEIIIENLQYCQNHKQLEIYAYVIMSNHLHLVCRRENQDLTELIGRFKSYTSKAFIKEISENPKESRREWLLQLFADNAKKNKQYNTYHIWQYTNHPILLYSNEVINQKIDYIHSNPVNAGYVYEPSDYKYSSANTQNPLKVNPM